MVGVSAGRQPRFRLRNFVSVAARRCVVVAMAVVLSLAWGLATYNPAAPVYESVARIQIVPPKSWDALSKDDSAVHKRNRKPADRAEFLQSQEFLRLLAERAVLEQMPKARREGGCRIWPGLDGSLDDAVGAVTPCEARMDEDRRELSFVFRAGSPERAAALAEMVPRLVAELDKARINRTYREVRSLIREKTRDFQEREKRVTQSLWGLHGSANAYGMGENAQVARQHEPTDGVAGKEVAPFDFSEYEQAVAGAQQGKIDVTGASSETVAALLEKVEQLDLALGSLESRIATLARDLEEAIDEGGEIAPVQPQIVRLELESASFRRQSQSLHEDLADLELSVERDLQERRNPAAVDPQPGDLPRRVDPSQPVFHFSVWGVFGLLVGTVFAVYLGFVGSPFPRRDGGRGVGSK